MPRQDIITALRNSLERGQTLEKAKQIMINSGYSQQDVEQAAAYATGGTNVMPQSPAQPIPFKQEIQQTQQTPKPNMPIPARQAQPQPLPQIKIEKPKTKKPFPWKILIMIIMLLILLGALGLIIIFRQQIMDLF